MTLRPTPIPVLALGLVLSDRKRSGIAPLDMLMPYFECSESHSKAEGTRGLRSADRFAPTPPPLSSHLAGALAVEAAGLSLGGELLALVLRGEGRPLPGQPLRRPLRREHQHLGARLRSEGGGGEGGVVVYGEEDACLGRCAGWGRAAPARHRAERGGALGVFLRVKKGNTKKIITNNET